MEESVNKNWSWNSVADWAETYDRRLVTYDSETFEWVADTIRSGRPNYDRQASTSFLEVLSSSVPLDDSETDWERRHRLAFVIGLEIEKLPPNDAWLMFMLYEVRLSLRFCARVLHIPKTTLARRRDEILDNLGKALRPYPIIREILGETKMTEVIVEQPQDLPDHAGLVYWEEATDWCYKALKGMKGVDFNLTELIEEGRSMFPEPPHIQWWADLLHAAEKEYSIDSNRLNRLLSSKQSDYGYKNILSFQQLGCVVRVSDKIARLTNLLDPNKMEKPNNESIEDSYYDLIGYCVIAAMLAFDLFTLPQR